VSSLLDTARARVGKDANRLFCAEVKQREDGRAVRLSFNAGSNTGPVTRVTGAGPTIEAAIDAAASKLERGKA